MGKTKGNTPKYGLIFHSTFIGRAAAKNKGRISRYLANKCTIASRIDCFSEIPSSVFGDKLRDQVEERLSFYETGEVPRKNIDVMKEAMSKASDVTAEIKRKLEKKEKKRKKREQKSKELEEGGAETNGQAEEAVENGDTDPKKKKKQAVEEAEEAPAQENGGEDGETPSKKKKKRKAEDMAAEPAEEVPETPVSEKKKKKKKKKDSDD